MQQLKGSMFSLRLMSKGEKRSGLDATVGGPNRLAQPLTVSINAKGGDCWHVYRKSVLVIDGKNINNDGMLTGKKSNNEEKNNDEKHGKHKFRRRSKEYAIKVEEE
jgi:hypothetical protein